MTVRVRRTATHGPPPLIFRCCPCKSCVSRSRTALLVSSMPYRATDSSELSISLVRRCASSPRMRNEVDAAAGSRTERDRSRIHARRRKGSAGRAASLVSPGPLARPCPAGRHARVGRLFQERFRSEEQPDAKPPKPSHAKTRPLAAGLSKPLFLSAFASRRKPAAVVHWDSRSHAFFSRAPPMKHDQFILPFLDTTIVAEGFGLYGGFPTTKSSAHPQINVEPEEAE